MSGFTATQLHKRNTKGNKYVLKNGVRAEPNPHRLHSYYWFGSTKPLCPVSRAHYHSLVWPNVRVDLSHTLYNLQFYGEIEDGEDPKSTAIRDLQEESGIVFAAIVVEVCMLIQTID